MKFYNLQMEEKILEMEGQLLDVLRQSKSGKISRVAALKALHLRQSRSALDRLAVAIDSMVSKGTVAKLRGHSIQLVDVVEEAQTHQKEVFPPPGFDQVKAEESLEIALQKPKSDLESKIFNLDSSTSKTLDQIVAIGTDLDTNLQSCSNEIQGSSFQMNCSRMAYKAGVLSEGMMAKLLELDGIVGTGVTPEIRSLRQLCVRRIQKRLEVADRVVKRAQTLSARPI